MKSDTDDGVIAYVIRLLKCDRTMESLGVKRPGREADHSRPSSAEVKECVELYIHSSIRLQGVVLS
jgi:hypothetical protein